MTKSLGRTYSLLDFSGREMHYWPGNLPRHRRVDVASPGVLREVLPRVTIACSRAPEGRNAPPPRLPSYFSFPPRFHSRFALLEYPRLRFRRLFQVGRPGTLPHVRKAPVFVAAKGDVLVRERTREMFKVRFRSRKGGFAMSPRRETE